MASSTVTRHSQVTIPKKIRDAAGIVEGDRVKMKVVEGDKIMIEKADKEVWRTAQAFYPKILKGCWPLSDPIQQTGSSVLVWFLNAAEKEEKPKRTPKRIR